MSTPREVTWDTTADMQPSDPHAMTINGVAGVWLPLNFVTTERGHTLLQCDSDTHINTIAWIELTPGVRLEIEMVGRNDPALHVRMHTRPEAELAKHIQTNLNDWRVYRCHVEGVTMEQTESLTIFGEPIARIADVPQD